MANHTLTRADLVAWGASPVVTAAEFFHLDQKTFKSPNFAEGGTYAPSSPVVVGGDGMDITGPFEASDVGVMWVNGEIKILTGAVLEVEGGANALFGGDASFEGAVEFESGSVVDVKSGADLNVKSGGVLTCESGSGLVIASGATAGSAATWVQTGAYQSLGALARCTQSGRSVTYTNVNQTIGVEMDFVEFVNTSASMVTLTLKIATAPVPTVNETIRVRVSGAGAGGKTIINEGSAANLAVVSGANAANFIMVFDGVSWRVFSSVGGGITLGADAY